MKKRYVFTALLLAAVCAAGVTGCESKNKDDKNKQPDGYAAHVDGADPVKKGVASHRYRDGAESSAQKLGALNCGWYYTWGSSTPLTYTAQQGLEFVPMVWGRNDMTDDTLAAVKTGYEAGTYKYLLTFNEPDLSAEANMTVDDALSYWDDLEALGIPLSSPAVSSYNAATGNAWLDSFMTKAKTQGKRVDFIAVHVYQVIYADTSLSNTVNDLKSTLTALYNKYKRPVWLTEFGAIDIAARDNRANSEHLLSAQCTQANTNEYVKQATDMLEQLGFVERYAWFLDNFDRAGARPWEAPYTALYDADDNITVTGGAYAAVESNYPVKAVTTALDNGKKDTPYNATVQVCGGTGDYSFAATGLPKGLSMAKNGVISGTPAQAGTNTVKVTVTDSGKTGRKQTVTLSFPLKITN